jgi:hypothetical protein
VIALISNSRQIFKVPEKLFSRCCCFLIQITDDLGKDDLKYNHIGLKVRLFLRAYTIVLFFFILS